MFLCLFDVLSICSLYSSISSTLQRPVKSGSKQILCSRKLHCTLDSELGLARLLKWSVELEKLGIASLSCGICE